jgi:acetyl-CoA acetyltransferase
MGFVCSGSSDYLAGQPFAFVAALNAVGPWPPLAESHVEMDGAFALFEAWLRLQHGDIDTALVYSFGKSSPGDLPRVLALQTDPYHVAPMFPDAVSIAGLQARRLLDTGAVTEERAAGIVSRALAAAVGDPHAQRSGELVHRRRARHRALGRPAAQARLCPRSPTGARWWSSRRVIGHAS